MKFRPGTPDDTEAAVAVWNAAHAARLGHSTLSSEEETRVRLYIGQPDSFLYIADDEGEVVGMSLGMQGRDVEGDGSDIPGLCHVSAVFATPERWGKGIGKGLVDVILSESRSRGYVRVQLWTHADNLRAQKLYEGKGFVRSSRTRTDDFGDEIVHYEREL